MPHEQPGTLTRSEEAILAAIRERGQATRAELAAAVQLSMAMTARLIARLQDLGLVRERGRAAQTGPGRQALLLEVHPRAAQVLGVDIGTELVHLLVADLHGEPQLYQEAPSSVLAAPSQEGIVRALTALIDATLLSAGIERDGVAVIGVAITGIIDSERGRCLVRSNTPGWEDFPLAAALTEALSLPVLLEETTRAKSVAEARLGVAQGNEHFLFVDAGTAIGASIVINRQPFRGIEGLAGELGHVIVDPAGALCRCGNRGCVQTIASVRAIVEHARELLRNGVYSTLRDAGDTLTLATIAEAAQSGDKLSLGLLNEAGERLGEAIGMALNLLGLDLVALGGALMQCCPVALEAATRVVQLRVLPIVPRKRTLVPSSLGRDAAARGVVLQAIDWLFAAPSERILQRCASRLPHHEPALATGYAR